MAQLLLDVARANPSASSIPVDVDVYKALYPAVMLELLPFMCPTMIFLKFRLLDQSML